MIIEKEIEILAESDKSWEDAARQALIDAAMSVSNILSIYLREYQPVVDNDSVASYCVNARISLTYEGE